MKKLCFFLALLCALVNTQAQNLKTDPTFIVGTGFNDQVRKIAVQADGKMIVGGYFTLYNGVAANRIIRLNPDGTIDNTFLTGSGFDGMVRSIKFQSDGKILMGGSFTTYNGVARKGIIRLNSDGTLDNTFNVGTGLSGVIPGGAFTIDIQSTGKIILAGGFTSYNGTSGINYIIRLNSDGTRDNTFNAGTGLESAATCSYLQTDDKIVLSGYFSTYNGVSANRIIRLNADGTRDATFNMGIGFDNTVEAFVRQPDGKLVVVGEFSSYNGISHSRSVRVNPDGSEDPTWLSTFTNATISSLLLEDDGKVIIGGSFTNLGTARNHIARYNSNGTLDANFLVGSGFGGGFNGYVYSLIKLADGKIMAMGVFPDFNGTASSGIIRLIKIDNPILATSAISGLIVNTAQSGGNITDDGGDAVTVRGICWNTSGSPTIANNKTSDGTGNGSFSSSLSGLTANTTYYVRAYATNSVGTGYGNEVAFTTSAPTITSFTPGSGLPGAVITITGTNFLGTTSVTIGDIPVSSFTVVSANSITAIVGDGASGNVSITTPAGTATKSGFTYVSPVPTITSFSAVESYKGQTIIITGTGFTGATGVTFGGIPAASFTVVSSTSISAVLNTGASGNVSVTTPGGTATISGFIYFVPPGNALSFNGSNNYAEANTTAFPTGDYTAEAWIKNTNGSIGEQAILCYGRTDYPDRMELRVSGRGKLLFQLRGAAYKTDEGEWFEGKTNIRNGQWTHVAVVKTANTYTLYVNGVKDKDTTFTHNAPSITRFMVGCTLNNNVRNQYFNGTVDEVRIWGEAKTPAQLSQNRSNPVLLTATNLLHYYTFDNGIAGANNSGKNILNDKVATGAVNLNLQNFSLTGTTSNWVESYAMVVPVLAKESYDASVPNYFNINWLTPQFGALDNYYLDVSTDSAFSSFILFAGVVPLHDYSLSPTINTITIPNISTNVNYYYRLSAHKTTPDNKGGYSDVRVFNSATVLPLKLLNFGGRLINGRAQLQWETTNEINTSKFIIERSANGTEFNEIGDVKASGNNAANRNYAFKDVHPADGINYYRLKMVDIDGAATYSKVVIIKGDNNQDYMLIYPVPAKDYIVIESAGLNKPVFYTIFNMVGSKVKQGIITQPSESVDISSLSKGAYYIKANNKPAGKFVKQ